MTEIPHNYYVDESGRCHWGCYDCKQSWVEDKKFHFSFCPKCMGGDTGVKLKDGTWVRFQRPLLQSVENGGKSPWEKD